MSNLNVEMLKRLFPKNTTRRQGGKVDGANRKRVQVMLPPDTLARLDELIEHDEQARSAAVTLACEILYATINPNEGHSIMVVSYELEQATDGKVNLKTFPIGWSALDNLSDM